MKGLKISEKLFKEKILRLEAGLRLKIPLSEDTVNIYYEKLCYFKEDVFSEIVEIILDEDDFFPSIARFHRVKKDLPPKSLTREAIRKLNN